MRIREQVGAFEPSYIVHELQHWLNLHGLSLGRGDECRPFSWCLHLQLCSALVVGDTELGHTCVEVLVIPADSGLL